MTEIDVETAHTKPVWDARYAGAPAVWSGKVNVRLEEQARDLTPGHALDIGCGEGGDAFWLAEHGWTVLATDISSVAIERAETLAPQHVRDRITFQQADILDWQPPADAFDLVSVQYLHLPVAKLRPVLARLADSVRAGGSLLLVNHDLKDHEGVRSHHPVEMFASLDELAGCFDPSQWQLAVCETAARTAAASDGHEHPVHDAIVRAVRL